MTNMSRFKDLPISPSGVKSEPYVMNWQKSEKQKKKTAERLLEDILSDNNTDASLVFLREELAKVLQRYNSHPHDTPADMKELLPYYCRHVDQKFDVLTGENIREWMNLVCTNDLETGVKGILALNSVQRFWHPRVQY